MAYSAGLTRARDISARTIGMGRFGPSSFRTMGSGTSTGRPTGDGVAMTDAELVEYLRENGYPEHICRAGRAGLLAKWAAFVDEVERGYKLGLEDYRNDLDL